MVPSFPGDGLGSPSQADWGPLRMSVLRDPSLLANRQGGPKGLALPFRAVPAGGCLGDSRSAAREGGLVLPACLGTPGCVSSTCSRASDCPYTALTNCSGNPGSFGVCAASGEGRGPGGCPPGITQPTAVPTVGAGAWQRARKPGSHDERLVGESVKSLKSSMDTSSYRLQCLPRQGGQGWRAGARGGFPAWACQGPSLSRKPSGFTDTLNPFYSGMNPFSPEWPRVVSSPDLIATWHMTTSWLLSCLSVCLALSPVECRLHKGGI